MLYLGGATLIIINYQKGHSSWNFTKYSSQYLSIVLYLGGVTLVIINYQKGHSGWNFTKYSSQYHPYPRKQKSIKLKL